MIPSLAPLAALLMGSAFLLFAGGVNSLILPIRGEAEGFTAAALGLLGTGWAVGYVAGCLRTPVVVARVGHIRAFGAMCAIAAIAVLLSLILVTPWVWIPVRALSGFCFAGAAMIVESWLNERSDAKSRGRVFGIYTMVNLAATTAGQMVLTLGDTNGYLFFVLAAMIYCLALLPTAISATTTPLPLTQVSLDLPKLWRNSPIAVFAVLMVGISNAAFGTLGRAYRNVARRHRALCKHPDPCRSGFSSPGRICVRSVRSKEGSRGRGILRDSVGRAVSVLRRNAAGHRARSGGALRNNGLRDVPRHRGACERSRLTGVIHPG